MLWALLSLILLNGLIGVLAWLAWRRVTEHLRNTPDAARLVAEHIIAPLLTGAKVPNAEDVPQPRK